MQSIKLKLLPIMQSINYTYYYLLCKALITVTVTYYAKR